MNVMAHRHGILRAAFGALMFLLQKVSRPGFSLA